MLVIQLKNALDPYSRVIIAKPNYREPEARGREILFDGKAASIPELLTQRRVDSIYPVLVANVSTLRIDLE